MKKKIEYNNSYIVFETGLSNTMIIDQFIEDTESYVIIKDIWIAPEDRYHGKDMKLIGRALKDIFNRGEIFIRYFLRRTDEEYMDYITAMMTSIGFEEVSSTIDGIMFVLSGNH